ncbi:MAG: hypothetical protein KA128_11260, partial [Zoogloea sp.]|nr:hypothetical protein [Zoogloea sp.]
LQVRQRLLLLVEDLGQQQAADTYSIADQVMVQATAVGITVVWSAVVAFVAYKLVDMFVGLRVAEDEEREGLDITSHGESAYHQ